MIQTPIPSRGVYVFTGGKGSGKSTLCFSITSPDKVAVLDYDISNQTFNEQLHFGLYHNMLAESASGVIANNIEVYKHTLSVLENIPKGKFDVIVVDNIIPVEDSIQAHVETYPSQYGLSGGQMQGMSALKWQKIKAAYRALLSTMAEKAQFVMVTVHLKQPWAGGQPVPGLFVPRGKDVLREAASLGIWLQPMGMGNPPSGLVLFSRLTKFVITDGRPKPIPVLPPRLPQATWDTIFEYMKTPYDKEHPRPGEIPNADEMHIIRGTVSKEQMDFMRIAMKEAIVSGRKENGDDDTDANNETRVSVSLSDFVSVVMNAGADMGKAMETLGVKAITEIRDYGEALEKLGL